MELGRWLKPGLQPDFNEVILAAVAAAIANRAMPELWPTLLSMSSLTATTADAMRGSQTQIAMVAIPSATWLSVRLLLSGGFITAGVVLCWGYPLGFLPALAVLTAWVAVLWCFPVLWLVLLPAVLPAVDFSPWTGWIAISEGDIAVLATLAVLLLRAPPTRQDIWPDQRVRLFPRFVLALSLFACAVDIVRGISPNWQAVSETLPAPIQRGALPAPIQRGALPAPIQRGALPAPVEPAFSTGPGMKVDIADVEMIGPDGRTVVVNGDFTDGTVRWFFTLDFHRLWRILDFAVVGLVRRRHVGRDIAVVAAIGIWGRAGCDPSRRAVGRTDLGRHGGHHTLRLVRQRVRGAAHRVAVRSGGDAWTDVGMAAAFGQSAG